MDTPADPATPFAKVYQSFLDDLALEGVKPSTIHRYRYNIQRFEKWLAAHSRPATLASLERTTPSPTSSISKPCRTAKRLDPASPRRPDEQPYRPFVSEQHQVPASWLKGAGHLDSNPFLAINPCYKKKRVVPVLRTEDRIPKVGKPSDVGDPAGRVHWRPVGGPPRPLQGLAAVFVRSDVACGHVSACLGRR